MNLLQIFAQVGEGMGNSILIFVLTLLFSLSLGLLVAFGRMNRWAPLAALKKARSPLLQKLAGFRPVQLIFKLFISILRGTPLMLQLMVVYFLVHCCIIAAIHLLECRTDTCDFLNAVNYICIGVAKIVNDDNLISGVDKFDGGV